MDPNEIKNSVMNPEDVTDQLDPGDIASNKIIAALSCIPFLFWLPLIAAPNSAYAKHYANQGLVFTIFLVVVLVAVKILSILFHIIPVVGYPLARILGILGNFLLFLAFLMLFVNAVSGKAKVLPVIGNMMHPFN